MARAGKIDNARKILDELAKMYEAKIKLFMGPRSLMDIMRLQQAIGVDKEKILETLALCESDIAKTRDIDPVSRGRLGVELTNICFTVDPP